MKDLRDDMKDFRREVNTRFKQVDAPLGRLKTISAGSMPTSVSSATLPASPKLAWTVWMGAAKSYILRSQEVTLQC